MQPIERIRRNALKALMPPPNIRLADWIEANVHLPETVSALSGRVTLWQFQKGICNAIDDPAIERVTIIKPVRVGFTTLLTATLANYVANSPAPILNVQPTEADARDYMVSDVEPTFQASPALRGLLTDDADESGRSTLLSRKFPAGSLKLVAAKSPRNLRRHTAKILLMDEVDAMEPGPEGDPLILAERRTLTFADRKIIAGSTPVFDHGPVSKLYAKSDQRIFEVPCPDCGDFTEILWQHIQWDEGKPETAYFACPHCGSCVDERHKVAMVEKGRWRATVPEVQGHAGFRLNALISPHKNASWGRLAAEFVAAKDDPATLQVFVNTLLGQPWREAADDLDESDLLNRREPFGLTAMPPEALIVTAGVDCQDDRLEIVFLGHGKTETFILGHIVIWGPVDADSTWVELDDLLRRSWPHPNGGTLRVDAAVIDSGDGGHSDTVTAFTRSRYARRVVAGKGVAGFSRPFIQRSTTKGTPLFLIGVDAIKSQLFNRLSRGSGFRFSADLEPVFFEQLASERRVVRYVKGAPVRRFERVPGKRAETLDATVYALAARNLVGTDLDRRTEELQSAAAHTPKARSTIKSNWLSGGI
ncbi:phage terminase large subunit family protein [Asticcacaulis tiandongensis]|uniref:phage terminase large subunit family protein n=1 Tax=Asticcacaulis tiandongensis TaxID=2565365 RepID=UPI0011279967|nr:phage terminase large subunit family protein [Asticcacaulis tiandongensis]